MRLTWLARILEAEGLTVETVDGWETRGKDQIAPQGIVCHHTATSSKADDKVVTSLLRLGRPDLVGPLAQIGLQRDGTVQLIAAGRANHNGYGEWGNDSIGIEAYNNGVDEPWPAAQLDAYVKVCAAICRHMGWTEQKVKGHWETDPKRKIDPTGIDMDAFRFWVALNILEKPVTPSPAPPVGVPGVVLPVLGVGARGGAVRSLQALLKVKASQDVAVDGVFGPGTRAAVANVQQFFGVNADGKVGPITWGLLFL